MKMNYTETPEEALTLTPEEALTLTPEEALRIEIDFAVQTYVRAMGHTFPKLRKSAKVLSDISERLQRQADGQLHTIEANKACRR
jgi:hypothetical protein